MQNAAELQRKVNLLEAELRDRDSELQTLRDIAQDQSQDVQAAKIIELSKKNRALNLALEREKQRAVKLQEDLDVAGSSGRPASSAGPASAAPPEAIEQIARSMVEQAADAAEAAQKEAAMWKDKLSQTTNRISQMEQKVFALEAENKKLTRALVREVGEEVPLARVLDDSGASDWKGRREQVIALRDQVKQLRAAAAGQAPAESRQEAAAKGVIGKISKERNQEMERQGAELAAARGELEALRLKYDGAISRRKILETELNNVKSKVAVILEKTQMDDKLIAALKTEVAALKRGGAGGGADRPGPAGRPAQAMPADDEELWRELGALRRRVAEQEEQIDRQEAIIMALQQRASAGSTPTGGRPGSGGRVAGWDSAAEQQIRLLEVENGRLMELVNLMQRRLEGS